MNKILPIYLVYLTISLALILPINISAGMAATVTAQPKMEEQIFHLINKMRAENHLPILVRSSILSQEALQHCTDMAKGSVPFGHDGFEQRFHKVTKLIPNTRSLGENVAYNKGMANPANQAVEGWRNSPSHYHNIMDDYEQTGIGVIRNDRGEYYFTQLFLKLNPKR